MGREGLTSARFEVDGQVVAVRCKEDRFEQRLAESFALKIGMDGEDLEIWGRSPPYMQCFFAGRSARVCCLDL